LVADWNRSQKARPEIIAEMEDWTLSGDWWLRRFGGMRRQGRFGDEGPEGVCGVDDISAQAHSPHQEGGQSIGREAVVSGEVFSPGVEL
jgi:hypothetical protein